MKTKKGQSLVEYALILALMTLIVITVLSFISKKMGSVFQDTSTETEIQNIAK